MHAAVENLRLVSSSTLPACRKMSSVMGSQVVMATRHSITHRVVMFTDEVTVRVSFKMFFFSVCPLFFSLCLFLSSPAVSSFSSPSLPPLDGILCCGASSDLQPSLDRVRSASANCLTPDNHAPTPETERLMVNPPLLTPPPPPPPAVHYSPSLSFHPAVP
ncbi:hypothetical protein INR49_009637, partial [Caranx melampygus]